jgi:hypothetical protein
MSETEPKAEKTPDLAMKDWSYLAKGIHLNDDFQ